jgi:pimeloyl-ACP methyl ester carboxylesterase
MRTEYVHRTSYHGFAYGCRVVPNPAPRTDPTVVLGGAYQNMHSNRRSEKPWAAASTLVSVELPGLGTADDLPPEHGFDFMAGALAHLLDELGLTRVNLLAVSYGTAVAHGFTRRDPGRVARLALVGATPSLPEAARAAIRRMNAHLAAGRAAEFAEETVALLVCAEPGCELARRTTAAEVLRRVLATAGVPEAARYTAANDRLLHHPFSDLRGVRGVATLCATGEHDRLCPPERARLIAAGIPGALFTTFRGAGHVVHLERPKDFADVLARFLTDVPLDGHPALGPVERTPGGTCPAPRTPSAPHARA